MRQIRARKKAYIQARADGAAKPYFLVNVELSEGARQDAIMDDLFRRACEDAVSKADVVARKRELLRPADT